MNELHELAKAARQPSRHAPPLSRRGPRGVSQLVSGALIGVGGCAWWLAALMRSDGDLGRSGDLVFAMWVGGAAFVVGNVWSLAAWLAGRRRETPAGGGGAGESVSAAGPYQEGP